MPSSLYHLKVADKITVMHPFLYTSSFFLGAIAPDSVNLHGFASKEVRWAAHRRARSLEEWTDNIAAFYSENKGKVPGDFLTGYVVHVLTDIEADRMEPSIHERILNLKPDADKYAEYSEEIRKAEDAELGKDWWLYARNKMGNSKATDINGIKAEEILLWRDYVLKSYASRTEGKAGVITEEDFDAVASAVDKVLLDKGICREAKECSCS